MARYRKNPDAVRKRTNLTIDPRLFEDVQEYCYGEGLSVSELVNRLLTEKMAGEENKKNRAGKPSGVNAR